MQRLRTLCGIGGLPERLPPLLETLEYTAEPPTTLGSIFDNDEVLAVALTITDLAKLRRLTVQRGWPVHLPITFVTQLPATMEVGGLLVRG